MRTRVECKCISRSVNGGGVTDGYSPGVNGGGVTEGLMAVM